MQNSSPVGSMGRIFPCIVCSLKTNSVDELHNHQKYRHTTEELSLSLICLVHYMCSKNEALGLDVAAKYPLLLKNHEANYHFCQLHNQRYNTNNSNDCAIPNHSLYGGGDTNNNKILSGKTRMAKALEQAGSQTPHYSLIYAEGFRERDRLLTDAKMISANLNTIFLSSWEIELGKVPEISDETFQKCVDGICKDLQVMKKKNTYWNSTNQRNRGKKGKAKRTTCSENFVLPTRRMRTKGLQRSETCAKSTVSDQSKENVANKCKELETTPIDYSTKLASFSQSLQCLNKNDRAVSGEALENPESHKVDQDSSYEGIPVLEKASEDLNYEQPLRDIPILESYWCSDRLLQQ